MKKIYHKNVSDRNRHLRSIGASATRANAHRWDLQVHTAVHWLDLRIIAFAILILLGCAWPLSSFGQSPTQQVQLRPIRTAVPNFSASALPTGTNVMSRPADPKLVQMARWLQTQNATLRSAKGQSPSNVAALRQAAAITNPTVNIATDMQLRRRSDGSLMQIKRVRPTVQSTAPGKALIVGSVEQTARKFLRTHKSVLESDNPDEELVRKEETADDLGRQHIRFAQTYKGIPVWPCELSVHFTPDGDVDLVESTLIPSPRDVITTPGLTAQESVERARSMLFPEASATAGKPELIIFGSLGNAPRAAWRFNMSTSLTDAKRCVVDAETGEVLSAVSLVHDGTALGSGVDALGITRQLNLWQTGATYYMADTSKSMYVPGSWPPSPSTTRGEILVYDSRNTPATSDPQDLGNLVYSASASANSGWVPDAVSAAYGLAQTFDYYKIKHGRNSFDANGGSLIGCVRVGIRFPNAFWTEQLRLIVFGDGYPRSLDVCGHEVTHGVIYSIGDGGVLDYVGQSGALNEAFADIFGEMVEARTKGTNDWLIGSQLASPIRSMSNPGLYSQPSSMSEFFSTSLDNGGVHINSGIINRAYFLLAAGLNGAIGSSDAERIFYRALTLHLQKRSQFIDARHACISSAEELFGVGSNQALKTAEAFDVVGILDAPPTATPTSIPEVQAPDSAMWLRFDLPSQSYYLVRRETVLGDASTGRFVNTTNFLAPRRISVSGDGSLAVFVTRNHDLGILATDGSAVQFAGLPNRVHSAALSPDGRFAAVVVLDSFGNATDQIHVFDVQSGAGQTFNLYAVNSEGGRLAVVDHADVMDFTADGRYLVYDALCTAETTEGNIFDGWAIFAMDVVTGGIQTLTDPNSDYGVGNPALGNTKNYLVTFDVQDNASGITTVYAGDVFSGKVGAIGVVNVVDGLGVPSYTGDDSAIVYSQYDGSVNTIFNLLRQPVASDGITKVGSPSTLVRDADYGVIYRRGTFISSNALPVVSITSPVGGQIFMNPTSIAIQASANDVGGTISRVEFYEGSTKLGHDTSSPYSFTWLSPSIGSHRLTARAVDNLGGVKDSAQIEVFVQPPPDTTKPKVSITNPSSTKIVLRWPANAVGFSLQFSTNPGAAVWSNAMPLPVIINGQFTVTNSVTDKAMFYRLQK